MLQKLVVNGFVKKIDNFINYKYQVRVVLAIQQRKKHHWNWKISFDKTSNDFDTNDLNNDEFCESDENDLSYECNLLPSRRHYNSTAIAAKLSIKYKM